MLALADACTRGEIHAEIALVLSNRADAQGIVAAQELGLKTVVVEHTAFASRTDFDAAVAQRLHSIELDWIVLAGFMRIFGAHFVDQWKGRILNIHPSLLPRYPGLNTHARAIAAGDRETGASVHIVTNELDAGPVIAQVKVPILPEDSPETLAKRVVQHEHRLYIDALKQCVNSGGS